MGSIISTIISCSFYAAIFGIGVAGVFLHKTLPSNESFHAFRSKTEPTSGIGCVDKLIVNILGAPEFKNFIIFRTVTLRDTKYTARWFGIANTWFRNDRLLSGILN